MTITPIVRALLTFFLLIVTACSETAPPSSKAGQSTVVISDNPAATQAPAQALTAWLDDIFMQELAYSPEMQTSLGMIDDLEAYGRWSDYSDEAAVAANERTRRYLDMLHENYALEQLSADEQLAFRFADYDWRMAMRQHEVRESQYVFSPMLDTISEFTTFLINEHRIDNIDHARAYVQRLNSLPAVIDVLITEAEQRAEAGVLLPRFAYPRLLASARNQITGAEFENSEEPGALYSDFDAKVTALELDDVVRAALLGELRAALVNSFQPAIERYIRMLEDMSLQANDDDGVWKLPDGGAFYASQLALYTTRGDLTAADIHRIGLEEVARIQDEMRAIMARVGFDGSLQAFFEHLRTDPAFYYPNTPEGRQQYLEESARLIDQVMAVAGDYFDTLPDAALEVRAVEPFREATATGAFYNPPALDGSRPGYYYVNLSDMANNPTYLMESLAYHEGAPGHHFQIALAQQLQDVSMMQRLSFSSAYGEGWGLYAEQLGKDMGFFTDPYMDFGRLSYEIFRAVRLVVDTGIHDLRWTRQQAIDYMLANTPMTEGDITPEVERYIVWPGQAVSYKIGMMTILELRTLAQNELGDQFRWGGFHDVILRSGALPLPVLTDKVLAWIETEKNSN